MQKSHKPINKQKGAALILMAFIIGLAVIAYLLHALDPQRLRLEQDKKTNIALATAKQALLAFAAGNLNHPGQLPYPDRNDDMPPIYDGKSDCGGNPTTNISLLIGELPIYGQTAPCTETVGLGINVLDAEGNRLWYAVSPNLVHIYSPPSDPVINPSIISNPAYQWLKVIDRNGALVSDRVAAVIIAPGNSLSGQNRTATAPTSEFLDTFKIGANTYSNADYTKPDEDFIIGEDSRNVSSTDTTFVQPYNFNDKLVYITIDELIVALNRRAAAEASNLLKSYKSKTGQFPYAANLGASLNNNNSSPSNQKGMLPIDATDTCSCTAPSLPGPSGIRQSCACSFKAIVSVTLTKNSGTWSPPAGACTIDAATGKKCTCTAVGSCKRGAINFTCDIIGNCTTTQASPNNFAFIAPNYANIKLSPTRTGCAIAGSTATCNDDAEFTLGLLGLTTPAWFKTNFWQDYFYYEWSSTPNLQVGGKAGINALLIGTGQAIGTQSRPPANASPSLSDYLDSVENTNSDNIFDATNKQKTSNYNDQTFIVAP